MVCRQGRYFPRLAAASVLDHLEVDLGDVCADYASCAAVDDGAVAFSLILVLYEPEWRVQIGAFSTVKLVSNCVTWSTSCFKRNRWFSSTSSFARITASSLSSSLFRNVACPSILVKSKGIFPSVGTL